jgi:plastocyanin domain-containing protein
MKWQLKGALVALAFSIGACKSEPAAGTAPAQPAAVESISGKLVKVTVGAHGFEPNSIILARGENVTLEFTRTTDKTCADKVVFPDLGVTKDLPVNTPVTLRVPTDTTRRLTFQCGMGMYRSAVVVQ